MAFIDTLPVERWFSVLELEGNKQQNTHYLNVLVSKEVLERKYESVKGIRRSLFYLKARSKTDATVKPRKCLQCGKIFQPTHKYNFLCGQDDVEYEKVDPHCDLNVDELE